MDHFVAQKAGADVRELDNGYGAIVFQWSDPSFGHEGLIIGLNADGFGHCSREMPIRSGNGPPHVIYLERKRIALRFSPALAQQLQLSEEIEIVFDVSDEEFAKLRTAVELIDEVNQSRTPSRPVPSPSPFRPVPSPSTGRVREG